MWFAFATAFTHRRYPVDLFVPGTVRRSVLHGGGGQPVGISLRGVNGPGTFLELKGRGTRTRLKVEHLDQLIPSKVVMLRDAIKNGLECPDLERIVSRDGNVMLALNLRGQSHVRAGLPTLNVSESAQSLG